MSWQDLLLTCVTDIRYRNVILWPLQRSYLIARNQNKAGKKLLAPIRRSVMSEGPETWIRIDWVLAEIEFGIWQAMLNGEIPLNYHTELGFVVKKDGVEKKIRLKIQAEEVK